nr:PREDICTED: uncharacterized protein LOC107399103 isoform X1 [Tribolium castaneum]|eukprot:XP_015840269.1 PREDICTED: uncharacterized protein LOC107399103 isoform X1 [Tribolium castaneum]
MGPKSKIAAYNSLIYRLFRIPLSPESFDREWNIIKQIAVNNRFRLSLINRIFMKFFNRLHLSPSVTREPISTPSIQSLAEHSQDPKERGARRFLQVQWGALVLHVSYQRQITPNVILGCIQDKVWFMQRRLRRTDGSKCPFY